MSKIAERWNLLIYLSRLQEGKKKRRKGRNVEKKEGRKEGT